MKWNTWIGEDFNQIGPDKRLLVLGESNFLPIEGSRDNVNSIDFVERNVKESRDGKRKNNKDDFFKYTVRCMAGEESPDMGFLDRIAYNVIIQVPMANSSKRPGPSHFRKGWIEVFEEIKRLDVKNCLFIGVGAANHFNYACEQMYKNGEYGLKKLDKIKGCYPRVGFVKTDELDVSFTFIRHAGRGGYKYWKEWADLLDVGLTLPE